MHMKEESPPALTKEAYCLLRSKCRLCCSIPGGAGGGTPSSHGRGGTPVLDGRGCPILTWLGGTPVLSLEGGTSVVSWHGGMGYWGTPSRVVNRLKTLPTPSSFHPTYVVGTNLNIWPQKTGCPTTQWLSATHSTVLKGVYTDIDLLLTGGYSCRPGRAEDAEIDAPENRRFGIDQGDNRLARVRAHLHHASASM